MSGDPTRWSIAYPGGDVVLEMQETGSKGRIKFPGAKPISLPHMDETLSSVTEIPDVVAWVTKGGDLVVFIEAAYSVQSSRGVYSFSNGNLGQYYTETNTAAVSTPGVTPEIIRNIRVPDPD